MSTREDGPERSPIEHHDELAAYLAAGCKPREHWRIGTEHEKFCFYTADNSPVPYEGERGIRALLRQMVERFGWSPIMEGDNVIGLKQPNCPEGGNISLEPAGQLELSGAPLENLHQTCGEVNGHLEQVGAIGRDLGINFLGLGFSPKWTLEETPHIPKLRYNIMRAYMPKVGRHGLDMMHRSCTVQVNLDFGDEADMVKKLRVSLALQPIATAIFANSPFTDGKPNGFLSYRSEIWRDTDNDRAGMLPFVFEDGMGFERYVDYALDVPMYFVYRGGHYIDASGMSFRDFLAGRLPALPGERPTIDDWQDHLSTIFPEVRLKRFLEMRGADGAPWRGICALPAVWVGLLYDGSSLDAAWQLVKGWTAQDRQALRDAVPRQALEARVAGRTAREVAKDMLAIAKEGLQRRRRLDGLGSDESVHLEDAEHIVETGRTRAAILLDLYENEWKGDIDRVFSEKSF